MSTGASRLDGRPGVVRAFATRVVRQEWAARVVTPMVDALDGGTPGPRFGVPTEAYENSAPALYVYRLRTGPDESVGVVAEVALDAFVDGGVRGHESVERTRVDALVRHYEAQPARSELVALLHAWEPEATRLVAAACAQPPLLDFLGPDGLEHTVWRVPDAETADLAAALCAGVHYIADGHHRTAARLRAWERAGRPDGPGILCLMFPMDGLRLSAFHRRVRGPVDATPLLEAVAAHFDVRPVPEAHRADGIALYLAGRWHDLAHAGGRPVGVDGLDVALLRARVLGPALGTTGDDPRIEVLPAHVPVHEAASRCDDDGGALFVLRPPSLRELTEIADRGEVMPAKTTYFAPKPYAGIFLTGPAPG